ncbi:MAG: hypothetical protein V2B20_15135 [Pseudomonadota bacterium]
MTDPITRQKRLKKGLVTGGIHFPFQLKTSPGGEIVRSLIRGRNTAREEVDLKVSNPQRRCAFWVWHMDKKIFLEDFEMNTQQCRTLPCHQHFRFKTIGKQQNPQPSFIKNTQKKQKQVYKNQVTMEISRAPLIA